MSQVPDGVQEDDRDATTGPKDGGDDRGKEGGASEPAPNTAGGNGNQAPTCADGQQPVVATGEVAADAGQQASGASDSSSGLVASTAAEAPAVPSVATSEAAADDGPAHEAGSDSGGDGSSGDGQGGDRAAGGGEATA